MSFNIKDYNQQFANRVHSGSFGDVQDTVSSGATERLAFFLDHMKSGEPIKVSFNTGLEDGTLQYINEQQIRVIMPPSDSIRTKRQLFNFRGHGIGVDTPVIVKSVDVSSKTVKVEACEDSDETLKESQEQLNAAIAQALRNRDKEPVIVTGRVFYVSGRRALVDIFDTHVVGVIDISEWTTGYTRNINSVAKLREWYEFEVTGRVRNRHSRNGNQWNLSRKNIAVDPWSRVPEDISTPGNTVVVKCVQKDLDNRRWWGTIDRLYDIEVMGSFNDSVKVIQDCSYKCKVKRFDKDAHIFTVAPFEFANAIGGFGTLSAPAEVPAHEASEAAAAPVEAESATVSANDTVADASVNDEVSLFADSGAAKNEAASA